MNAEVALYSAAVCPYAQRTRLLLREKGVRYDTVEVDLKNKSADFLAISPYSKVPVIKRGKDVVWESSVINEYLDEFHRGDFLVRNLLGADAASGTIALGALPRMGQTLQFQRRDADAATEDMKELLSRARKGTAGRRIFGGCLCTCNGRGSHLFGMPHHDAGLIQEQLGKLAITGFFCNGEIGPVGSKNFLHGYTASLGLFVER